MDISNNPYIPAGISKSISNVPLKDDLEVMLVVLREVMRPRQLASTLPSCEKTQLILADCIKIVKGFDFLSKTSETNEGVVGKYFDKYPAMRDMQERNPVLMEVRKCEERSDDLRMR